MNQAPAIAGGACHIQRAFMPEDAKVQGPFRVVIRWVPPHARQRHPQQVHLELETPRSLPGVVSNGLNAFDFLGDQDV